MIGENEHIIKEKSIKEEDDNDDDDDDFTGSPSSRLSSKFSSKMHLHS